MKKNQQRPLKPQDPSAKAGSRGLSSKRTISSASNASTQRKISGKASSTVSTTSSLKKSVVLKNNETDAKKNLKSATNKGNITKKAKASKNNNNDEKKQQTQNGLNFLNADELIPKTIGDYTLKSYIGEGASCIVKLAIKNDTKVKYACKIIDKERFNNKGPEITEQFEREIRVLQQIKHPNIVQLCDMIKDDRFFYIFIEYCPRALFDEIYENKRISELKAANWMSQLLDALSYIHSLNIIHRDLKPENILLDENDNVKLTDFGLSRFVGPDNLASTPCGSPSYTAPEVLSEQPYDGKKSDCWSCGVILYFMVVGKLPWENKTAMTVYDHKNKNNINIPDFVSYHCRLMIQGFLDSNPETRLTAENALDHPFLNEADTGDAYYDTQLVSLRRIDNFFCDNSPILDATNISSLAAPTISCNDITNMDEIQKLFVNGKIKKFRLRKRRRRCKSFD